MLQRMDISAHAITAHKGLLQKRSEEELSWPPDDPLDHGIELNWNLVVRLNSLPFAVFHFRHIDWSIVVNKVLPASPSCYVKAFWCIWVTFFLLSQNQKIHFLATVLFIYFVCVCVCFLFFFFFFKTFWLFVYLHTSFDKKYLNT